jgi:hypothetical protein
VSSRNLGVRSCLLAGGLTSLPGLLELAIAFLQKVTQGVAPAFPLSNGPSIPVTVRLMTSI